MNGNNKNIMKFTTNPFYLYPVRENMIDTLFVDRDEEINLARGILRINFENTFEVCAVIGGIGVGKSSFLYYVIKIAKEMGYKVKFYSNPDEFYSASKKNKKNIEINLIDDVGKISEDEACKFYTFIEKYAGKQGIIFFSDIYKRDKKTLELRKFTVSQNITLPQGLSKERLKYFLEERMKKCLSPDEKFKFPFDEDAIEMANIRSTGNLRNFFNYTKNSWVIAAGGSKNKVSKKEMESGIIAIDRALLGSFDLIDYKILWYSTQGEINKSFLAHQCGIDSKTLENHIEDRLFELISQKRSGKDILITSIYRYIEGGQEILDKILKGLGIHKVDLTG